MLLGDWRESFLRHASMEKHISTNHFLYITINYMPSASADLLFFSACKALSKRVMTTFKRQRFTGQQEVFLTRSQIMEDS